MNTVMVLSDPFAHLRFGQDWIARTNEIRIHRHKSCAALFEMGHAMRGCHGNFWLVVLRSQHMCFSVKSQPLIQIGRLKQNDRLNAWYFIFIFSANLYPTASRDIIYSRRCIKLLETNSQNKKLLLTIIDTFLEKKLNIFYYLRIFSPIIQTLKRN